MHLNDLFNSTGLDDLFNPGMGAHPEECTDRSVLWSDHCCCFLLIVVIRIPLCRIRVHSRPSPLTHSPFQPSEDQQSVWFEKRGLIWSWTGLHQATCHQRGVTSQTSHPSLNQDFQGSHHLPHSVNLMSVKFHCHWRQSSESNQFWKWVRCWNVWDPTWLHH